MKVHISAPHSNYFVDAMEVYLAGTYSRPYVTNNMKIYLAGGCTGNNIKIWKDNVNTPELSMLKLGEGVEKLYILESFYYIKEWMNPYINKYWNFILDSGAFTFMVNANKGNIDWNKYVKNYANYINNNNVNLFFELDIDSLVGIKEVERLRDLLEGLTSKKCIPVWHKSRGLDYYKWMVKNYSYIAIGGLVTKEIEKKDYGIFTTLLRLAKEQNCKVHGLGFTNLEGIKKFHFHSVDSTAWLYGNRGGFLYTFNGQTLGKIPVPEGKRLKGKEVAIHNFKEWVKFQKYADVYL